MYGTYIYLYRYLVRGGLHGLIVTFALIIAPKVPLNVGTV